jgi:hypothetical protein
MDSNVERNRLEDRQITGQLYGGNEEMRLKQEMLLGIGGVRALEALGWRPPICHINEGHAAFAGLERLRLLMREKKHRLWRGDGDCSGYQRLHDAHACSPPATMSSRASWPASISAITPRNWA